MLLDVFSLLACLAVLAYTVWDMWRECRRPKRNGWDREIKVVNGYQALETLRRAKEREAGK